MNTASEPSDETPLHIIRRFTQYWRNDYARSEEWSRNIVDYNYVHLIPLHVQQKYFAAMWDDNLEAQGLLPACERHLALHA